jgi:dienelactone hydrolase
MAGTPTTSVLRRATVAAMVVAVLCGTVVAGEAGAAPASTDTAITLRAPTGPYRTGTTRIHLRDTGRIDPLDPQGRDREVMVQLWYPARGGTDRPLAPYAPPGEAAALRAFYDLPEGAFTATTHSRLDAPVQPGAHRIVFLSHGLCASRTDNTQIAEQLASLGFVVAALANTHESAAVEFPGGRVETTSDPAFCTIGGDPFSPAGQATFERLLAVRVADIRYTLDELQRIDRGHNPSADRAPLPAGLAGALDTRRVGIFGHSFGGGTAAAVIAADRRFAAGVNLDGLVVGPTATTGLDRPFLVLGSSYHEPGQDQAAGQDPSWTTFLPALRGWHRWLRVTDAGHYRFIDLGGSVRRWGLEEQLKATNPEAWRTVFGDIDDARSQTIVVELTSAFFERFLLGRHRPVLDHASTAYPEVQDLTATIDR